MNNSDSKPYYFSSEIEECVIGTCCSDGTLFSVYKNYGVNENWFYNGLFREVWLLMDVLESEGEPIDPMSITLKAEELGKSDNVKAYWLAEMAGSHVSSGYNADMYMSKLSEYVKLRRIYNIPSKISSMMLESPVESNAVLTMLAQEIENIEDQVYSKPETLGDLYNKLLKSVASVESPVTFTSGIKAIDNHFPSYKMHQSTVIAGETSVGKTSLLTSILRHVNVHHGYPVALFSLEMDGLIMASRILSSGSNVSLSAITEGKVSIDRMIGGIDQFKNDTFYIDTETYTLSEFEAKCRFMAQRLGVKAIGLDYIQLLEVDTKTGNREQEVSLIGKICRKVALRYGIHTFALSQLDENWGGKYDKSNKPTKSNLRESKALGHHCNNLMLIYKDKKGIVRCNFDKATNNSTFDVPINWHGSTTKFS